MLLNLEVAAIKIENISVLREQKREDPFFEPVSSLIGATVHKEVLHPRVTVDVTVEEDVSRLEGLAHHHLGGAVLRALFHTWSDPLSVQIVT